MPETQIKIGGIRQSLNDFLRQQMGEVWAGGFPRKNYIMGDGVTSVVSDLRLRYKSNSPFKRNGRFRRHIVLWICDDFEEIKGRWELEIADDLKGQERFRDR